MKNWLYAFAFSVISFFYSILKYEDRQKGFDENIFLFVMYFGVVLSISIMMSFDHFRKIANTNYKRSIKNKLFINFKFVLEIILFYLTMLIVGIFISKNMLPYFQYMYFKSMINENIILIVIKFLDIGVKIALICFVFSIAEIISEKMKLKKIKKITLSLTLFVVVVVFLASISNLFSDYRMYLRVSNYPTIGFYLGKVDLFNIIINSIVIFLISLFKIEK